MNRRAFLRRLVQGVAAIAVAPTLLETLAVTPAPVALPAAVSVRYIEQFAAGDGFINRFDILYGFATVSPDLSCRIVDA